MAAALTLAAALPVAAQAPPKSIHASRLTGQAPTIDGRLDDAAWAAAPVISDFVQRDPDEGKAPTFITQVRLLYDDDALYVAARMLRPDAHTIRRSISRRDSESDAEVFLISLDPYLDRRTGYTFSVNSGGVRGDRYHAQDQEGGEAQYDPVWSARSDVDDQGWSAEMRIPFSQLRFNAGREQVWGLQITRNIPDKNEKNQWTLIPRDAAGYISQFGTLEGIAGIPASRRLELLPYAAASLTYRADVNPKNPFAEKSATRIGGDLKMGLGPNLTLDATIHPDFGQVEADPADVNLSAFETVFAERRPFFTEGAEALTGLAQNFIQRPVYFYSRRIGAPPRGSISGDFVKQPTNTTILSAAKVTGRLKSGLSIGALAAVTPREYARSYDSLPDTFDGVAVEPPNAFAVIRLQQDFGKQQSNAGLNVTYAHHFVDERRGLQDILSRNAFAGGVDWKLRSQQGKYELTGFVGASHVEGDSNAIARLQRGSAHYYQRPDQDHIRYDAGRRSLSGYTVSLRHDKNAGRFTLWGFQLLARSPGFEINDLGRMQTADDINFNGDFILRDTKPHRTFRSYMVQLTTESG
ncbi:MAG: carbohydrate binding family 9 domain-containing protein [Gemmatimonadales bacterium]|nr:carbohydrate binding family 9 domain-containing protein [Gemmatimonadales bacterium]